MKIKTTVYSHKVIDVVKFYAYPEITPDDIYALFADLADKTIDSIKASGGIIHIKVDRPASLAESQHRLGVLSKNLEKKEKHAWRYNKWTLQQEHEEYLRLKEKFGE